MWLRYGVDANNTLVAAEDTQRGKTNLGCPYCGNRLIAKKGRVKEHHFAHDGETCNLIIKTEPRSQPTVTDKKRYLVDFLCRNSSFITLRDPPLSSSTPLIQFVLK